MLQRDSDFIAVHCVWMESDLAIRQEVFRIFVDETKTSDDHGESKAQDACVICLETISEKAQAQPCGHSSFDFLCLVSWLERCPSCPLCKSEINVVHYDLQAESGHKTYDVKPKRTSTAQTQNPDNSRPINRSHRYIASNYDHRPRRPRRPSPVSEDASIERRRHIYRNGLYSLHVGSNRISRYRNFTPKLFREEPALVSRARKWIRRELRAFEFLNPDADAGRDVTQDFSRRTNNAEFLLEYIIAILKTVDIRSSSGQAEEMLREFIGRENARLFLHELGAWIRSPYESLQDWDRAVQYGGPMTARTGDKRSSTTRTPDDRSSGSRKRRHHDVYIPSHRSHGRRRSSG